MIEIAAIAFTISLLILAILLTLVSKERRSGRRFFASSFRSWLDNIISSIGSWLERVISHFVKYVLQLSWYYSIHSILKTCLRVLVSFYSYFENIFESNRKKAKQLRSEKKQLKNDSHLQQMAAHKEDTSLTPAQKKKLNQKELEGKY